MALGNSADRLRDSFEDAAPKSREQRIKILPKPQQQMFQKIERDHQERLARLKAEQAQQREAAIQEVIRRRLAQNPDRHLTPGHTPPRYAQTTREAARQAGRDVAAREARDLAYLQQQHEKGLGQMITSFEGQNRQQARDIMQARTPEREGGRER